MDQHTPSQQAIPRRILGRAGPVATLAASLMLACARDGSGSDAPATGTTPPRSSTAGVSATVPAVAHSPEAQVAIDASLREAASRLGVPAAQVQAESAQAREWPNSALGCPQPGFFYAQVITPGYLVIVGAPGGKRLEYHTDTQGRAVFCREL